MSKTEDLGKVIGDMRDSVEVIKATADWLAQQLSELAGSETSKPEEKAEPKTQLKLEDVRAVLAEKSRAGHTAEVRELLRKYGASKLSAVAPKDYEALIKDAEALNDAK